MKPGETVEFRCPFCGLGCFFGRQMNDDGYALAHVRPECATFLELEVDEFIAAVNDATIDPEILKAMRSSATRH